jgi:hypothetical protein
MELGGGALKRKPEHENTQINFCVARFGWQVRRCLGLGVLRLANLKCCATAEARIAFEVGGVGKRYR